MHFFNLRHFLPLTVVCVFLFLHVNVAYGEPNSGNTKSDWIRLAGIVLNSSNPKPDRESAARELIAEPNEARFFPEVKCAMVVAYTAGIGTKPDSLVAAAYLSAVEQNKSDKKTYRGIMYHALGLYYKYERYNYAKALECFQKGAELDEPSCLYCCGFMYYKGLGCKQDYAKSIPYFRESYQRYPASAFMLGLCYRNGYGVKRNNGKANYYLHYAAKSRFLQAIDELAKTKPENRYDKTARFNQLSAKDLPTMPNLGHRINTSLEDIEGTYRGILATYDWSGAYLIEETPLTVNIKLKDGRVVGQWIQGKDVIPFEARVGENGALLFDNTTASLYDRYAHSQKAVYLFQSLQVHYLGEGLAGKVSLFSLDEGEPCRPMYINAPKMARLSNKFVETAPSLTKSFTSPSIRQSKALDESNEPEKADSPVGSQSFYAFCSPTTNQITLRFPIPEEVSTIDSHNGQQRHEKTTYIANFESTDKVLVEIYTLDGKFMCSFQGGRVAPGAQIMTIAPDLPSGQYILILRAGKKQYQTVFVK